MWLAVALFSAICFATVYVVDEYCVDNILQKPYMGVITSALASISIFFAIPFTLPIVKVIHFPENADLLLCLIVGVIIQINQGLYFKALSYSTAGTIAGYWNMVPALLPILSYLFLGSVLELDQYRGIYLIVLASIGLSALDTKSTENIFALLLMLVAVVLQVTALLLMAYIFKRVDFHSGFLSITTGMIVAGVFPLLMPSVRRSFSQNYQKLSSSINIFIGVEIMNLVAYGSLQKSIHLSGEPSLVAAIDGTAPGFAFIFSMLFFKNKVRNIASKHYQTLFLRLTNICVMVLGVWMVS